ncbi:hypothetical protein M408DRAFT_39264, partial [Serendipita vermifera MAFF 305830]
VPNDVLDDCEKSFLAAQESNSKASKNFFADTGLMALLCRHDRVIFLANLVSSGEKQHYALALLDALFKELPESWKVGVLYDIGCQLHRSCDKYDLIGAYRPRITWSISVFHAYGHQWPCQLVYHPRKRKDFGFSDGEGCERFWSSISRFVAPLRVSGYHRRIFCLNIQIQHLMSENLMNIGRWLSRKQIMVASRQSESKEKLNACPVPINVLRREWQNQITSQTQSIRKKSNKSAAHAVGRLILLRNELSEAQDRLDILHELLRGQPDDNGETIEEEEGNVAALRAKASVAERALGTGWAYTTLEQTRHNKYLENRYKALAMKQRLLSRLQARKFELSKLNQSSRRPAFGASFTFASMYCLQTLYTGNKLYVHTKGAVQRREVGIKALAYSFNRVIDTLSNLRTTNARYKNETLPKKINVEHLFRLDVFSNIWDDDGLLPVADAEESWRTNESVRNGINAMLELDRCTEEAERLDREMNALATWCLEE